MKLNVSFTLNDTDAQEFQAMRAQFNQENHVEVKASAFARKLLLDTITKHDFQASLIGE